VIVAHSASRENRIMKKIKKLGLRTATVRTRSASSLEGPSVD